MKVNVFFYLLQFITIRSAELEPTTSRSAESNPTTSRSVKLHDYMPDDFIQWLKNGINSIVDDSGTIKGDHTFEKLFKMNYDDFHCNVFVFMFYQARRLIEMQRPPSASYYMLAVIEYNAILDGVGENWVEWLNPEDLKNIREGGEYKAFKGTICWSSAMIFFGYPKNILKERINFLCFLKSIMLLIEMNSVGVLDDDAKRAKFNDLWNEPSGSCCSSRDPDDREYLSYVFFEKIFIAPLRLLSDIKDS